MLLEIKKLFYVSNGIEMTKKIFNINNLFSLKNVH